MLNLYTLSQFKKVAETEHVTRAAEELHVAQSALSRTLSALEEDLGVRLFDRVGKNIALNDYGRIVLKHTETMLREEEAIRRELRDCRGEKESVVRISMQAATMLLPELLVGFRRLHPEIRLEIFQGELRKEQEERCDLRIFAVSRPLSQEANASLLLAEQVCLGLPLEHPLAERSSIDLRQAQELDFICLPKGRAIRSLTDELCARAQFEPRIRIECDSPEMVRQLIAAGQGVSFVPAVTWKGLGGGRVVLRPLRYPKGNRYLYLSAYERAYLSHAVKAFRDYALSYFVRLAEEAAAEPRA